MLPFHIFKILFPKSANKLLSLTKHKNVKNTYKTRRQLGTCYLTLMHKEKENDCKFFIVQDSSLAVLGMPDIDNLDVLPINCETIGRKVASDENIDSKRNCQHERAFQTEGRKFESYENKRQDTEVQSQHNADNTAESSIVTNPTVISNNRNENSFFSETIKMAIVSFQS